MKLVDSTLGGHSATLIDGKCPEQENSLWPLISENLYKLQIAIDTTNKDGYHSVH